MMGRVVECFNQELKDGGLSMLLQMGTSSEICFRFTLV